jgi:hypothetical protein
MEHLKNLTVQQLVLAACGAVVVGGVMLSRGNDLGFLPLALAVVCGLGAFAKSRNR